MPDRLQLRRSFGRALSRLKPMLKGALGFASQRVVMGKELWLRLFNVWKTLAQRLGDRQVNTLAASAQEAFVCGFLNERVLEGIVRVGRIAFRENEARGGQS